MKLLNTFITSKNFDKKKNSNKGKSCSIMKKKRKIFINPNLYQIFIQNFPVFQKEKLSLHQMFTRMCDLDEALKNISFSTFYRHFIKKLGISYRKVKYLHKSVNQNLKEECRPLTTFVILKFLDQVEEVFFYDESSFQITYSNDRVWSISGKRPLRVLDSTNISLSLNIVCSNRRIVSFCISERNLDSSQVFNFIHATFEKILDSEKNRYPYMLILDNGPKNRTKLIRKLSKYNIIRYVYTTPTTPQHNLAECVFLALKRNVRRETISTKYVIRYLP